jgi:hypothetical protein
MAITNPFSITYGDRQVGGSTDYQLLGPYVIEKSYDQIRLVFDVVVVGTTYADLQDLADNLESDFRKRLTAGDELRIDLDGSAWVYTVGETILKCTSSVAKSGSSETDRGYSRAYTITIQGELPADATADGGLRELEVNVDVSSSRQKTVTMRGVYTATTQGTALERYQADFDAKAADYLTLIKTGATFELVAESYNLDREQGSQEPEPHVLSFTRQYTELLFNQALGIRDDVQIRDHRVTFTDLNSYPGDAVEGTYRLHRIICSFDCSVDIDETTNAQAVFLDKIRPNIIQTFQETFDPQVFGIEDQRVTYDETTKRMSAVMQFLHQPAGAGEIVEISESVTYRENRTIDYTPVHDSDELAFYADTGWTQLERIWTRTLVKVGEEAPQARISSGGSTSRTASFSNRLAGIAAPDARPVQVSSGSSGGGGGAMLSTMDGWTMISNTSQMTPSYVGLPGDQQIQITTISDTIVERFHRSPGGGGDPGFPRWRGGTP